MTDPAATLEPLAEPVAAPAPASGGVLASLTAEQRGVWLKTGDLPASGEAPDPPADATIADQTPAPETKPAKTPSPRHDINARLGQLSEQKRAAEARAEAAERRAADLEARTRPTETSPPEAAPAPPRAPAGSRVYQTPKGAVDFSSGDPDAIVTQFITLGYADPYAAMNLFTPQAYQQFAEADRSAREQQTRDQALVASAFTEVAEKHPDWSPDRLNAPELNYDIPPVTARLIFESPVRADVIYYFSEHPAEGRAIAAMDPLAAARALGALETTLSVVSSTPATRKTVSSAPSPGTTLGSRHQSGAGDDLEDATRARDTRRYIDLANQRELAQRHGVRG